MNSVQFSSLPQNPFIYPAFWGRQNELRTIYKHLISEPPQCCSIIGETYIGKTTLLRYLADSQSTSVPDDLETNKKFTFVYLDCGPYFELASRGTYASTQFWWDLYTESHTRLKPGERSNLSKPMMNSDRDLIDTAFEIKFELEGLIRGHPRPVIFVLDDFEGVTHLPLRDSEWLRAMARLHCAYVVASRHLLYLLYQYHQESWATPSPLWNLFADPIYLGLIPEQEIQVYLAQASQQAEELGSHWEQQDIAFIRNFSGRHPELIRIACAQLFEQRLGSDQSAKTEQDEFLAIGIYRAASPICDQLWRGLTDPELWNVPGVRVPRKKETRELSPYQKYLIRMAKGEDPTDKNFLFVLEQRGLIERIGGKWRIFAEVMRRFVLEQEQVHKSLDLSVSDRTTTPYNAESPTFAYLEGKVYDYLKAHIGEVCDREEIKRAVWEDSPPTNSALQKIIERIREKIEPDPNNPRYLIAVRGQGFMLRE